MGRDKVWRRFMEMLLAVVGAWIGGASVNAVGGLPWCISQSSSKAMTSECPHSSRNFPAPHFAEVETETQEVEMPSKPGSLGASPIPEPAVILLALPSCPSPSPFLSQSCGGVCSKDRGPGILFFSGTRTLEPKGLAPNPASAT